MPVFVFSSREYCSLLSYVAGTASVPSFKDRGTSVSWVLCVGKLVCVLGIPLCWVSGSVSFVKLWLVTGSNPVALRARMF